MKQAIDDTRSEQEPAQALEGLKWESAFLA